MCTKQEVREVIRETVTPSWIKNVMNFTAMCAVLFLGWLAYTVHMQESNMIVELNNIRLTYSTSNLELLSRIDRLDDRLVSFKETAYSRSNDRYTGTQARAREKLLDERCKMMFDRVNRLETVIEKHHKIP